MKKQMNRIGKKAGDVHSLIAASVEEAEKLLKNE